MAVNKTMTPRFTGDTAVKHEINNVIVIMLIIIKVIGYPYNKRLSSLNAKSLRAEYTIL